jgi:hypothetical protein
MLFNISQVIHTGYVISVAVLAVMEIPDWSDLVADRPRGGGWVLFFLLRGQVF